jgi:nucleoside-diphosphate-sugar epimerase
MRIAVIGANGVLGRHVVPRLIERGHSVRAGVRDESKGIILALAGAEVMRADILDGDSLLPLVSGCEAVLHLATAIPRPGQPQDWTRNDRVRSEGTGLLLKAARRAGVRRIVAQSVAMIHAGSGDTWVSEDSPFPPVEPRLRTAVELEAQVRESGTEHCILRGGLFYGPGTGREDAWREAARAGTLRLPEDGGDYLSLIHVVDMARAMVDATVAPRPSTLYLVADNQPAPARELLTYIARQQGAGAPPAGGARWLRSFRVSNAKLRAELQWEPAYPTYRVGLA